MPIVFVDIPQKFIDTHHNRIHDWLLSVAQDQRRDGHLNIIPREPFASPSETDASSVATYVTLCAQFTPRMKDGAMLEPAVVVTLAPHGRATVDDWAVRHKHTTREQFDWYPFAEMRMEKIG